MPPCGPATPEPDRTGCVTFNFYGSVDARGSRFGNSREYTHEAGTRLRHTTGRLPEAEVQATVSDYVPSPEYGGAVAQLRRRHLVILAGPPGSGRRAGAMALLYEVAGAHVIALPPTVAVHDLADWDYQPGCGYLVLDSEECGSTTTDAAWQAVSNRLRSADAYLVVTIGTTGGGACPRPAVAWHPPPRSEVLRAHLASSWAKDDVDELVDFLLPRLPQHRPLRWLAGVARLVNARRDPVQALQQLAEEDGEPVERWFGQPRTRRELAEVVVTAFLDDISEPNHRLQLARLEQIMRELGRGPVRPDEPAASAGEPGDTRFGAPPTLEGLVHTRYVASPTKGTGMVSFRKRSYQRLTLARLWDRTDSCFLDAVRAWVEGAVGEHERGIPAALAALAVTSFDRVESEFLAPWSRGRRGWPGTVAATYVLWCMCRDEATAPLALRAAIRWVDSGDANQRATAMLAFTGELGVCYPIEAARRLWQLVTTTGDLRSGSLAALGRLFASLVDQTQEAGAVLTLLHTECVRYRQLPQARRLRRLTDEAALSVLTVTSHRTGRPAVAELLRTGPEWYGVVADLSVSVLRGRPGEAGHCALWHTLQALPAATGGLEAVRLLGHAVGKALAATERADLRSGLIRYAALKFEHSGQYAAAVLDTFLAAVAVTPPSTAPPGPD